MSEDLKQKLFNNKKDGWEDAETRKREEIFNL